MSSMLYEFTNKEQDQVINAFRINSFVAIRDLPDHIAPTNVIQHIQTKMKEALGQSSVISQNKRAHMEKLQNTNGYFRTFEWMEDHYNNTKEAH